MPKVPKWAADAMESLFSGKMRKVRVSEVAYLNPYLKKITFRGDLRNINFKIGQAVALRVDDTNYRNYTPSFWNSEAGICEMIFHLHGNGPGSEYINKLQVNDELNLSIPRGFDIYKKEYKYHFLFGDETTIGLFKSLKMAIEENEQDYLGVLELHSTTGQTYIDAECMLEVVPHSDNKAEHAVRYLESLSAPVWQLWKNGVFYLIGNAGSIQNFRKALKAKGISNKNIITQPYWAEGKIGL